MDYRFSLPKGTEFGLTFCRRCTFGGLRFVGVKALHIGPFRETPASEKPIKFSGLDFWMRDGDKFTEDWIFVDMVDMYSQMGHDLFKIEREEAAVR